MPQEYTEHTVAGASDLSVDSGDFVITGCAFATIYVDDFPTALNFYTEVLGLRNPQYMGSKACYFSFGDFGLYLIGGNIKHQSGMRTARLSFALDADHILPLYHRLQTAGITPLQEEPMQMNDRLFWFQFYDPAGNILEIAGPL